ncbi:hypothetical protein ABKV19_020317 [Rosa sericea]
MDLVVKAKKQNQIEWNLAVRVLGERERERAISISIFFSVTSDSHSHSLHLNSVSSDFCSDQTHQLWATGEA